jgi:hypothetical protein
MSKLTQESVDVLLVAISNLETTLSELSYFVGVNYYTGESYFDMKDVEKIDEKLNWLWDEMSNLCNSIAAALQPDGPSPDPRSGGATEATQKEEI